MLWRHPAQRARWELAAASLRGFRATLDGLGFTEVTTPKLVESATESGADVFFERVYEVGPVFRAEPHDTVRHLAEYRSLDVELGFIRDHRDVLAVLREVLAGMVAAVAAEQSSVARTGARLPVVPEDIPVIHFADALALVGAPEHERALGTWALEEHGSDLLAVEGHPMAKRPFYTHPQPGDGCWSTASTCSSAGWSW